MSGEYSLLIRSADAAGFVRSGDALMALLGLSDDELAAKPLIDWIHPDDRDRVEEALRAGNGIAMGRHATKSGDWIPFAWRLQTEDGVLHALGEPSVPGSPSPAERASILGKNESMGETLTAMALIVESKNPGMRCSILLVDPETQRITVGAGPSLPAEYNAAVEGLEIGPSVGSCGTAAYWNVPVVVSNIQTDPLWRDLRGAAKLAGVEACWSQPIRTVGGEVLGAMALYDTCPSTPERHQMDGLAIAARMVGLAIERGRLEAQVRHAAKMEALGVLAGGVAHDFNNLLGVILGNADLALAASGENATTRDMLTDIVAASESASALCNQLLAYAGRSALSTEIVDCNALIRDLSKLLNISLSKKAELRLNLTGDFGVLADRGQLRQVLMNLITNAAEAIGNAPGEVLVSTRELTVTPDLIAEGKSPDGLSPGDYAEVSVRDSGVGMDSETRQKIFDPFFSTKADGRGLGLAAVKGIVEAHGWSLSVDSVPNEGTTFTLLLPRKPLQQSIESADGEEVFGELKRIRPDVRVLLTSGFTEQEVLDRFRGGGLCGAVQKPFGAETLVNKVLEALH